MSIARDIVDRVFFPKRDLHPIPVLDGGFSPNERLDTARLIGEPFEAPDALAFDGQGSLFVSAGHAVYACDCPGLETRRSFAEFDSDAGGLAWSEATGLLACVSGRGVCALDAQGRPRAWLEHVDGTPVECATAVTVAADGTVYVTEGSRHNRPGQWLPDLMQKRPPSGRLIACDAGLGRPRVLAQGLDWPAGAVVSHDERSVLVTESWAHRLRAFDRDTGAASMLVKNFAGYPSRIVRGDAQDYWMAFFALRTQLTEFVLREHAFRARMMASVPQSLWIGPTLGGTFDYREPTQIGRIKKLGIQKPWAPPRSYGLVARLDRAGLATESFHSRTSGRFHGVTGIALDGGRVVVSSKGHGRLAELPIDA